VPTAMSGSGEMHKYGNTDPPKDYELYHRYIQAVVQAMVDEFGLDRVRTWRFRVMTEPDLHPGHWAGTKEEYLKLYDYAVDAVTHVIPDADIGPGNILNPGVLPTDQSRAPRWGLDIIDHAATGTNYRTGKTGTRMRFMSCSWYGRVGRCIDSFDLAVEHMRSRLDVYPQSRELPVEVAEFAPLLAENGAWLSGGEASEWGGSWMAAIADRVYQRHVRQVHQWATTTNGMPLPRTHVLAMLERMVGGQRLAVTSNGTTAVKCGAIACQKDGRLQILVYHHRPARYPKPTEHVTLTIRDRRMVAGQSWILSERLTDANHGTFIHDFYSDCEKAGIKPVSDEPPFGGQVRGRYGDEGGKLLRKGYNKYMAQARLPETKTDEPVAVADGQLTLHFDMDCHSVRLLELTPSRPAP
jgi:xylan 1,4-beta-xylosidase